MIIHETHDGGMDYVLCAAHTRRFDNIQLLRF